MHWKYVCLSGGVRPTWQVTYILMGLEFLLRTQERGNLTSWHEKIYAGSLVLHRVSFFRQSILGAKYETRMSPASTKPEIMLNLCFESFR